VNWNGGRRGDNESEQGEEGRRQDAAGHFREGKIRHRSLSVGDLM
jgi:hypothetical protein